MDLGLIVFHELQHMKVVIAVSGSDHFTEEIPTSNLSVTSDQQFAIMMVVVQFVSNDRCLRIV